MATATLPDSDEQQTQDPNESDKLFTDLYGQEVAEGTKRQQDHASKGDSSSAVADQEAGGSVPSSIKSNFTGAKTGPAGVVKLVGQIKDLKNTRNSGPAATIVALLAIVITIISLFGGTAFLGQAITGNLLQKFAQSVGMFSAADNNLMAPKFFGKGGKDCTVSSVICSAEGITPEEFEELKANGVKFTPENGHQLGDGEEVNRLTFDSMEVNNVKITDSNIVQKMDDATLRKKLFPVATSALWNSEKNYAKSRVKSFFGISENPDTRATTKDELKKKVYSQTHSSVADLTTKIATEVGEPNDDPDLGERVTDADVDLGATTLLSEAEALEKATRAGELATRLLPTGDILAAIGEEGRDIDSVNNPFKKAWGWINSVDFFDAACTGFQLANTAAGLARTISLMNTVRFGSIFIAAWDKQRAGDSSDLEIGELMNVITAKNSYGESFDVSASMQYVFNGTISTATPMSVSSVGGQTIQEMYNNMTTFGNNLDPAATSAGGALAARIAIKNACGLVTNLAFQVGATLVDWGVTIVTSVFTGGGTAAANIAGKAALKGLFKEVKRSLIDNFTRDFANLFSRSAPAEARKQARANLLQNIKKQATDPVNLGFGGVFVGLTLVETFGMDYIVQSLAGTDVLAYMDNSVQTADAIVTTRSYTDYASCIAAGCHVLSKSEAKLYAQQNQSAIAIDTEVQKQNAQPLDIQNNYSAIGSFANTFATKLGGIDTSGAASILRSILGISAFSIPKLSQSASAAGQEATIDNLSSYINDPFYVQNNIANDIVGTPLAGADLGYLKSHSAEAILKEGIDKGYIYENGGIASGSAYATHVDECNNPARLQVDSSLFDAESGTLQPAHCRESTDQRDLFNALSTYRARLVDDANLPELGGNKIELAQKIIDKGNVRYWPQNGGVHPTLEDIVSGKIDPDGECGININILLIIDAITDKYPLQINDLNRRCGDVDPGGSAGLLSRHYAGSGSAIDIQLINTAQQLDMAKIAMPIMAAATKGTGKNAQVGFGGNKCAATNVPNKPSGVLQISDNCGSLHLDVPPASDPDLKFTPGV